MKLAVVLLTLAAGWASAGSGSVETASNETSRDLLKRAASQLERLSAFRRTRVPEYTLPEVAPDDNELRTSVPDVETKTEILEAQKRIDELRATASEVLRDPRYAAIMQDRIKRSFISGIANKLIGGAVGAVSGLSRGVSGLSASNTPNEYETYGHSYEREFSVWDFKKAIINTLIQAIKAIGGGAIAGGGAIVKGGGSLISAKGRFISSAGDAIASLGKSLASSAIIASDKPVYGPPGYSYGPPPIQQPIIDHVYDGPPPSADAYAGPGDGYNADHSSYVAPSSNDGVDNDAGVVIVKETNPEESDETNAPSSAGHDNNSNLGALEESFGGPSKETTTITKIIGVLNSGQPTIEHSDHQQTPDHHDHHQESGNYHHQESGNYHHQESGNYHHQESGNHQLDGEDHQPSTDGPTYSYEALPLSNDQANVNGDYHRYPANVQIYDSYGTKLESSPQLGQVHRPVGQDNHQSLALPIHNGLSPLSEVPNVRNPETFGTAASSFVHYDGSHHQTQPFKVSILENNDNLIHHPQSIAASNYYGLPNYGAHQLDVTIGHQANSAALPILPQDFRVNGPTGFGQPFHLGTSGGSAVLGVWRRTATRSVAPSRKMALLAGGPKIQRSVGYRLMNGRLTRT